MPFDVDGLVDVEGGLAPMHVDLANDHAVYVEPYVWMYHDLRTVARCGAKTVRGRTSKRGAAADVAQRATSESA